MPPIILNNVLNVFILELAAKVVNMLMVNAKIYLRVNIVDVNNSVVKPHVFVCDEHRRDEANKSMREEYRSRCITRIYNSDLPECS